MNKPKTAALLLLFAAAFFFCAAVCVYAACAIGEALRGTDVPVTLSSRVAEDGGSPYSAVYDGSRVRIMNASGREVYRFELTSGAVPDEELAMLSRGVTVGDAEAVWSLIESYTS